MSTEERRARQLAQARARYATDPDFRARALERARAQRAREDPEKARAYHAAWARAHRAANLEKVRADTRASYAANREKIRAEKRAWRAANLEQERDRVRAWRAANQEKVLKYRESRCVARAAAERAWRAANQETFRARRRAWYAANRKYRRARGRMERHARRARWRCFGDVDLAAVYARDAGVCYLCRQPVPFATFHLEHIVPIGKGGVHAPFNVATACQPCNARKHASLPALDSVPSYAQEYVRAIVSGNAETYLREISATHPPRLGIAFAT